MTMHAMDCAALDERLADYLEGDLAQAEYRQVEAHLASCVRCAALVRDLERIRVGAADLPELTPSTDLWSGIARRIETPVVPFAARVAPTVAGERRRFDRLKTAAIAAALVAVTAGVTYTLTVNRSNGRHDVANVTVNPGTSIPGTNSPSPAPDDSRRETVPATREFASPEPTPPTAPLSRRSSVSSQNVLNTPEAVAYSLEIDRLRTIFTRNRSQLDPRTAAIIEANLKVIDDAIAQSKAALAQDPASGFLSSQLNNALGKKVELLRTAALLPSRT